MLKKTMHAQNKNINKEVDKKKRQMETEMLKLKSTITKIHYMKNSLSWLNNRLDQQKKRPLTSKICYLKLSSQRIKEKKDKNK